MEDLDDTHTLPTIGLAGIAASIGLGVGMTLLQRSNANSVKSQPVQDSLGEYVDVPDYRNNPSVFISNVIEDIQSVIKSIPEKDRPMVVFIDDLDRCSPNNVVGIVEAVSLFLGGGYFTDCAFVIGVDTEMVAAALEYSYSNIIGKLQDSSARTGIGWRFMDKFVIPPSEQPDINNYVDMLFVRLMVVVFVIEFDVTSHISSENLKVLFNVI